MARAAFSTDNGKMNSGIHLSVFFEYGLSFFRRRGALDLPAHLSRIGRGDHWRVLITPPLAKTALSRSLPEAVLHSQPRLSMLNYLQVPETVEHNRSGLYRR